MQLVRITKSALLGISYFHMAHHYLTIGIMMS